MREPGTLFFMMFYCPVRLCTVVEPQCLLVVHVEKDARFITSCYVLLCFTPQLCLKMCQRKRRLSPNKYHRGSSHPT